jgi:hypothetical protein
MNEGAIAGGHAMVMWSIDLKKRVKRLGKVLLASSTFQTVAAACVYAALSFVYRTNRHVPESDDLVAAVDGKTPVIVALWHGQQLLAQFVKPGNEPVAAVVSRSADAEINARVLKRADVHVIRGSGGRERAETVRKGGVRALKGMKDALAGGLNVVTIADISKGTPRQAGEGIVTLARISGRPIVPMAIATSRYHVVKKSWDKTTINLPFGRACLKLGVPIYVPRDASDADLEILRQKVTDDLNCVTQKAYQAVGATE